MLIEETRPIKGVRVQGVWPDIPGNGDVPYDYQAELKANIRAEYSKYGYLKIVVSKTFDRATEIPGIEIRTTARTEEAAKAFALSVFEAFCTLLEANYQDDNRELSQVWDDFYKAIHREEDDYYEEGYE
jgi:hypothetical protein